MKKEIALQREYYTRTANQYESMHVHGDDEHDLACALMAALASHYQFQSVLDVGSGTGRAVAMLSRSMPGARVVGLEPVEALRNVGYANGISQDSLIDGDATKIDLPDASFDLVCEFGVLHHIRNPRQVVSEMLRVSRKAIFLSDNNRFGQGSSWSGGLKLLLWKLKLWPMVDWVKTKGRGYAYGEGDGVSYSYSVFDDYDFIRSRCDKVMVWNLNGAANNVVLGAANIGLFATKSAT
jgi:ubiquinone/menaquinone biosynthesis C-methylase UbiE